MLGSLNLDAEYDRLEREQRALTRKEKRSESWHEQGVAWPAFTIEQIHSLCPSQETNRVSGE